ncbi:MAG: polyphosphate polymerase domain-containing protein [Tannerellaceae bacterium]|nr:polyphosphate polymerase domain-containing protein [Tannerellaceae bacterium]
MNNEIVHLELQRYDAISLEEMDAVKLMNRTDTKYLMRLEAATQLLRQLRNECRMLVVEGECWGRYRSQYYDTSDLQMFYSHITGRYPRFKVRERHYSQNDLSFFEIKRKSNGGRTSKKRLPACPENQTSIEALLYSLTPFDFASLKCVLISHFNRVTLVNKAKTERITLDFNLSFNSAACEQHTLSFPQIAVLEVKQNRRCESFVSGLLHQSGFRPTGMSKYCVGMFLVNRMETYKRYKPNLHEFLKLQYA